MPPISKDTCSRSARNYHSAAGRADKIQNGNAQVGRPADRRPLPEHTHTRPAPFSSIRLPNLFPSHVFTVLVQLSARPTPLSLQRPSSPARPHLALFAPRSCPSCAPPTPLAPCSAVPPAACAHPRCRARRPPLLMLVVPSRASGRSPPSQGHLRARPMLVVLARRRSAPAPTRRLESTGSGLFLPLCCKCMLKCFRCYHMYAASVSYGYCKSRSGCCICCKCFRGMLKAFVQNVSSVSDVCCRRFRSRCCTYFTHMFQEYVPNISIVSVLCCNKCFHVASCKCFIQMLHMFHTHVAIVCFKCFIYFRCMLHPYVLCSK